MFFFKKKKKGQRRNRLVKSVSSETPAQKRSAFRMPVEFPIAYTLQGRRGRRSAHANDLSAGGLRLTCDEDLLKGSIVTLDIHLPDDFLAGMTIEKELYGQSPFGLRPETVKVAPQRFAPMQVHGKILATFFNLSENKFAHGIAFVDIDTKTEEELQRFIHLWQINYLRTRRGDLD
jgi:c-di-GMP-binding flagellar brake protein YcgR